MLFVEAKQARMYLVHVCEVQSAQFTIWTVFANENKRILAQENLQIQTHSRRDKKPLDIYTVLLISSMIFPALFLIFSSTYRAEIIYNDNDVPPWSTQNASHSSCFSILILYSFSTVSTLFWFYAWIMN